MFFAHREQRLPSKRPECVHRTPHRTHIFLSPRQFVSLRSVASSLFHLARERTCGSRLSQGSSFFYDRLVLRASQQNILSAHVSPWCSCSVYFLFDSTTILDPFSRDADWNQIKPPCAPPRGWTVWPSGCTTPYHNMQSKRCISSVWTLIWRDKHWKAHPRAHKSLDAEACCDSCCGWDSSRDLICVLVCLWLLRD